MMSAREGSVREGGSKLAAGRRRNGSGWGSGEMGQNVITGDHANLTPSSPARSCNPQPDPTWLFVTTSSTSHTDLLLILARSLVPTVTQLSFESTARRTHPRNYPISERERLVIRAGCWYIGRSPGLFPITSRDKRKWLNSFALALFSRASALFLSFFFLPFFLRFSQCAWLVCWQMNSFDNLSRKLFY